MKAGQLFLVCLVSLLCNRLTGVSGCATILYLGCFTGNVFGPSVTNTSMVNVLYFRISFFVFSFSFFDGFSVRKVVEECNLQRPVAGACDFVHKPVEATGRSRE